jgi:NADPH:quinone reductase-like Zn-dependent oxidoreductase
MRRLPSQEKAVIAQELMLRIWPLLERGLILPVIDSTFPMSRAADAHRRMEEPHIGKIILTN